MTGFTLDTSGFVTILPRDNPKGLGVARYWRWSDLSPFTQGYVEAPWVAGIPIQRNAGQLWHFAFSDLSPAFLARIIRDCERIASFHAGTPGREDGRTDWHRRQNGQFLRFPLCADLKPLRIFLNDQGQVDGEDA